MSGRIALGAGTACFLLLGALGLWVAALVASAGSACAGGAPSTGFETLSAWPPGERCGSGAGVTIASAIPWAAPVIVGLVCLAGFIFGLGLVAQMQILRARVRPAAELRRPEPALAPGLRSIEGEVAVADLPLADRDEDLRHAA